MAMTITRARKTRKQDGWSTTIDGDGWILYGNIATDAAQGGHRWFERWYPTEEKAQAFATKRGWSIKGRDVAQPPPSVKPRMRVTAIARQIA